MPKLVYQVTTNQQRGNPELAWQAPYQIAERLGSFEFDRLSRYHPIAVLGGHFILIRAVFPAIAFLLLSDRAVRV